MPIRKVKGGFKIDNVKGVSKTKVGGDPSLKGG